LPGKLELPDGHINHGETLEKGLRREFREEFGVDIIVSEPFYAFTYMNGLNHVVEVDYLAELTDGNQEIKLDPKEHLEYLWLTRKEFEVVWDKSDGEYPAIQRGFDLISE
jgi:8-oxo-dGTP pyrophosphatase MutT (NUDIX family)